MKFDVFTFRFRNIYTFGLAPLELHVQTILSYSSASKIWKEYHRYPAKLSDMLSSKEPDLNMHNEIKEKLIEFIYNKDTSFTKAEIKHFVSNEIGVEVK